MVADSRGIECSILQFEVSEHFYSRLGAIIGIVEEKWKYHELVLLIVIEIENQSAYGPFTSADA